MNIKTVALMFISTLTAVAPTVAYGQTDGGKAVRDLNAQIAAFQKAGHKGWTCRDTQDGKRMHRLDPTNVARMGNIKSSEQGFLDNKTPLAALPVCTLPR
jgi:hypothetical protein